MSANAITTPYHHFVGLDGLPLEDGYIYIGTANTNAETSPISIYWDSDLTIPAAQPIRTVSGYMSKNGSPGTVFVNGDYSITVRDKNGVLIYTAFESNNVINITFAIVNSTLKTSPDTDDIIPVVDNLGVLKHIPAESIFKLVHGSATKTPADNDELMLLDSAALYVLKKFTWASLKSTLKTYFDTIYMALTGDQSVAGIKTFSSSPVVPDATTATQALAYGQVATANSDLVKTALNASGTAPIYACRAWANFNGKAATVAIRGSGNVSSITDVAAGNYVANLITAMEDTNFAVVAMTGNSQNLGTTAATDNAMCYEDGGARTTTSFKLRTKQDDVAYSEDRDIMQFVVFR